MTTNEFVSRVAKKANVTKKVAAAVLKSLTSAISESLKKVGAIRIKGIGSFTVSERKARTGVNPRTLEKMNIPASKSPRLLPAQALKDAVKAGEQEELALDVRDQVQKLWSEGNIVSAFDVAMKSLLRARQVFGNEDLRTAGCMIMVAEAALHREKYYLAGEMYRKALSIQERTLGTSHPDVVRCKTCLADLERDHGR